MDARIATNAAFISAISYAIEVETGDLRNLHIALQEARTKSAKMAADKKELKISALGIVRDETIARLRRLQQQMERERKIEQRLEGQLRLDQELERGLEFNRSLKNLPNELRLEVMHHTRVENFNNFRASGLGEIFDANPKAVFRGMEAEQYPELSWLFGNISGRSPKQKLAFKDFIGFFIHFNRRAMFEVFESVDNDQFSGRFNLWILDIILQSVGALAKYADVGRRAALCLASFVTCRVVFRAAPGGIFDQKGGQTSAPAERSIKALDLDEWIVFLQEHPEAAQTLDGAFVDIPLGERIALYEEQSAATQSEIRRFLQQVVFTSIRYFDHIPEPYRLWERYIGFFGGTTAEWIKHYHSPAKTGSKKEPRMMRRWLANLVTGFVLEVALRVPDFNYRRIGGAILCQPPDFDFSAALGMEILFSDSTDDFWKGGREFAQLLNFDLDYILEGTEVGSCLQRLEAGEPI